MIRAAADACRGPILIGAACRAQVLTPSVAARGVIQATTVAVAEARDIAKTQ